MRAIIILGGALLLAGSAAQAQPQDYPRCGGDMQDHCLQDQSRARDEHHGNTQEGVPVSGGHRDMGHRGWHHRHHRHHG